MTTRRVPLHNYVSTYSLVQLRELEQRRLNEFAKCLSQTLLIRILATESPTLYPRHHRVPPTTGFECSNDVLD